MFQNEYFLWLFEIHKRIWLQYIEHQKQNDEIVKDEKGRILKAIEMPGFSVQVPRQTNVYDCGCFVIEFARLLTKVEPAFGKHIISFGSNTTKKGISEKSFQPFIPSSYFEPIEVRVKQCRSNIEVSLR